MRVASSQSTKGRTAPHWVLVAASAVALALVFRYVLASGTWLDEYWQLWISGAPAGSLVERLVNDTHPPWFNLLGRAILWLTGSAVVPARLVNLTLVTAALGGGLYALRGLPAELRWRVFLLLVATGGAVGFAALGSSFRVYPWLLALAGLQAAVLLTLVLQRPAPSSLAAIVTAISVGLHYGHAAGAIAIALVTIALAWRQHTRGLAWALAMGLAVGAAADLAFAIAQSPHWRAHANVSWIAENPGGALSAFAAVLVDDGVFNLIAVVLIVLAVMRGNARPIGWLLAPLPLAFAAWLTLDAAKPIIVPRYLPSATALFAVAAAYGWYRLRPGRALDALIALVVALQPLVFSWARPPLPGWEVGARNAAAIKRECPDSPVYAIPAGRFGNDPDSPLARFETPVMGLAYASVGQKFGLRPQFVTSPTPMRESRCPAIVWMEAAHGIEHAAPDAVLRRAQLEAPENASARFIPTPNGALLLISSADRLQRRP
jgi:hypothetical protein